MYNVKVEPALDDYRYRSRLVITDDDNTRDYWDGGEPEDNTFGRDWSWVKNELLTAYEQGRKDRDGAGTLENRIRVLEAQQEETLRLAKAISSARDELAIELDTKTALLQMANQDRERLEVKLSEIGDAWLADIRAHMDAREKAEAAVATYETCESCPRPATVHACHAHAMDG